MVERPQRSAADGGFSGLTRCSLVILGDSIVSGWGLPQGVAYPALLQRLLDRGIVDPWRVIDAGVPGDTVVQGCLRWDRDVAPAKPSLLLIAFGLNDGALRRTASDAWREDCWLAQRWHVGRAYAFARAHGLPGAEPAAGQPRTRQRLFRWGLNYLVTRARRSGSRVCLLSPTPVLPQRIDEQQYASYGRYHGLVAAVARRLGVPYLDLWQGGRRQPPPERLVGDDGVHLSAEGHRWLAGRVFQHLCEQGLLCTTH
jgi:lysophospholipase L1-like esterase